MLRCLVIALALLVLPGLAYGDASIVQDACIGYYDDTGKFFFNVEFSVVNFSLPAPVCDLHFTPEPQPPMQGCEMIGCGAPEADPVLGLAGWSCFLTPQGGGDWFANSPADCIAPGSSKGGFSFLLDPDYCCYVVQFTDPTGAIILEQEECFCSDPTPTERSTWGLLKSLYK